jgi:uncharacterized protein
MTLNLKFCLFDTPGKQNTEQSLILAKENADIIGIKNIIIASTEGYTAEKAVEIFDPEEYSLIIITHSYGFRKGIDQEFNSELRTHLTNRGVQVFSGTHTYSGIGPSLFTEWKHLDTPNLFAKSVRKILCDGVKVCHEIVMMAADSGLIPLGSDIISIAGTGRGADTVCWITANSSRDFLKVRIKAILAKPL